MSRRGGGTPRHPTAKLKGGWSPEEDALLASLVEKHGEGQWSPIARELNELLNKTESTGRIGKQCRERWNHHLCPGLRKGPWTPEEEALVVEAHKRSGNRWSDIARCIEGRSENAVKNHWNATLRKKVTPENPAGPLKEYLDTLQLEFTPRRRGAGGASAGSGGGGPKRKRSCREQESSSVDSDEISGGDDAEQETRYPELTGPCPRRGAPRPRRSTAAAAARYPHSEMAAGAGGSGAGGPRPFSAAAAVAVAGFGHSVMKSEPVVLGALGPSSAQKRFSSVNGTRENQEVLAAAAAYGGTAATSGETVPERAAVVGPGAGRRRSKRAAAQVGNERLRSLVEAEQREAAAEAAEEEEEEEEAAAAAVGSVGPGDGVNGGEAAPGRCPDAQSFETEVKADTAAAAGGGAGGAAGRSQALTVVKSETLPRTESSCDSGSLPDNILWAIAADVAEATDGAGVSTGATNGAAAAAMKAAVGMEGVDGPVGDFPLRSAPFPLDSPGTSTQGQNGHKSRVGPAGLGAGTTAVVAAEALSYPAVAAGAGTCATSSGGTLLLTGQHDPVTAATAATATTAAGSGGAGWANRAYDGSTNDMQVFADGQQSRRSSYGMSLGGKVRPRLCPHREAHTHTNALDTAGVPNIVGAVSGGVGVGTSAAALGVGTRTDASPGTSTPVPTPGMAAVDGTPSVFLSRTCGDDEDLLLDTPLDYSETMCLRHVASGGALFDYDMRHGTKRANRLATPPSPTKAAAAARNSPAAAMAALPAANPSLPWTARFPHRSFPGCVLEPSCLFEDSPSDNMPDTPLNQPGENLPTLPEPEGRGSGNLAAAAAAAGGGAASGPGNAAVGVGQIQGQAEAAVREAEAMSVNAMSPYGFLGGVGAAGGINAIRANSSITSVGSPLSDVYVENGESGVRVGGTGGATSSHAGTMAAAAASAAAITAAAVGVAPSGGGGLADSEVLTKRESCINPPLPHGAVAMHPMAPFKTAAPLALSLPAAGLQPASPWTPAQGMSISAPPMSLTHTMPTQPASPGHWADQLPPGQASGASVHMPYGFGAGSTMAPPAMPSFTASSPLSPAHMPHVLPAQSSHTVTATPTAPQLQRCQQVLMQLGGSHEGASILQSEHGHVQQHPPHSVVMSQSFPLLSTLAPPATSAPPSGPPPQRQQSGTEPSQLQPLQPLLALQTQQPQPHALVPDVYFMSPGCYYLPPGTLLPFGGFFNPLSPYSPASGHPPAAAQMPVPMQRCTPCHYVQGTMSQTEEHQHLQMMQGMVSVSQQQQQQQQRRKEQPQPLPQWTSLQLLQQSMSHQQLQQLPQSMSHQQLLPLQRSASQLPEQQQQLQPQESA